MDKIERAARLERQQAIKENLRILRTKKGMSAAEVEKALGWKKHRLANIEDLGCTAQATDEEISELSKYYKTTIKSIKTQRAILKIDWMD
jgi:transcriptional regulator with XRE-family HTH domain